MLTATMTPIYASFLYNLALRRLGYPDWQIAQMVNAVCPLWMTDAEQVEALKDATAKVQRKARVSA